VTRPAEWLGGEPGAVLPALTPLSPLPPPRSPSEAALRRAVEWRLQAHQELQEEIELSAPSPLSRQDERRLFAQDRAGCLRRALAFAQRAAALARGTEEAYRATLLRAQLEGDAGHNDRELLQAQRLMDLAPRDPRSLAALRQAGLDNGRSHSIVRPADH
jgi:hypothetical protein